MPIFKFHSLDVVGINLLISQYYERAVLGIRVFYNMLLLVMVKDCNPVWRTKTK